MEMRVKFKTQWEFVFILIKAPAGGFKGKDRQNPVEWEFTILPVSEPWCMAVNS